MTYPKITIITPSYNQGQYLEQTILSVLNQNYPNLEYIVIDGGSTDNSVEIIKKHEDKIAYWISEKDKGQSDAINKGFQKSTGEIINWLNSDDYMEEGSLFAIARSFSDQSVLAVTTVVHNFEENGENWEELTPSFKDEISYITQGFNNQPGTYFRKKIWDKYFPLPDSLHYTMDQYLWFCFWLEQPITSFKIENYTTVFFRRHEASKTSTSLKEFTFNKLGEVFFNEHNLIFWSFLKEFSHPFVDSLTSYFSPAFDYKSRSICFPRLKSAPSKNELIFQRYLFTLLEEDYKHGFFKRLKTNLKFIKPEHLDNDTKEKLNTLKRKAFASFLLKPYRSYYWQLKKIITKHI